MNNYQYGKMASNYNRFRHNKRQQKDNKQHRFRHSYEEAKSRNPFLENVL
jgi:hypothetical protein